MDTGSDLYATVGEKAGDVHRTQNRNYHSGSKLISIFFFNLMTFVLSLLWTASLGATKQINHSQHSSTSQPDDSSPYARVRSHAYDKVRPAEEHPYAQIAKSTDENENRPTTSNNNLNTANNNRTESASSRESLRDTVDSASHQVRSINQTFLIILIGYNKILWKFYSRWYRLHQRSQVEFQLARSYHIWHRQLFSHNSTLAVTHKILRVSRTHARFWWRLKKKKNIVR